MLKKTKCSHCVKLFQPIRIGHLYCSATCRKLEFKAKKRAETKKKSTRRIGKKLEKLSGSSFGRYLVRELKRAKTVEILQGHTADSLTQLVALRRACTAASGFENGESLGVYELSHIYPVGNSKSALIGLLNTNNLTITPKEFNRKHSTKTPTYGYIGESIPRKDLDPKLRVLESDESTKILQLVRSYIGEEFDSWLNKHVITATQRQALLRNLKKAGFNADSLHGLNLEQLKAMAADEDVAYFHMSRSPESIENVLIKELGRLNLGSEFLDAFKWLDDEDMIDFCSPEKYFTGTVEQRKQLKEFMTDQSLACLHGQPYESKWNEKELINNFKSYEEVPRNSLYNTVLWQDLDEDDDAIL